MTAPRRSPLRTVQPAVHARTALGLLAAAALGVAGCLPSSPAQINTDVQMDRQHAFHQWTNDRQSESGDIVRVDGPLTLNDAIKVALQYNKDLQSIVEGKRVARGQALSAYQIVLPTVTVSAYHQHWEAMQHYAPTTPINRYGAGFQVTQLLHQGELIPATLRSARLFQALADEAVRGKVQDVIYETAMAYYDVVLAQELTAVNASAVESTKAQLDDAQKRRTAELAVLMDVLRAEVEVANAEVDHITQKNNAEKAITSLLRIMGVSQDSAIQVVDKLEFFPMVPVFERAVELAFTNRPDLITAEMTVRQQCEALRMARSAWWPSFSASVEQTWSKPNEPTGSNDFHRGAFKFGLNGQWILNAADTMGQTMAASATLRQRQIELNALQDKTLQEIHSVMKELVNAEGLVQAQEKAQGAAVESLRLASVGYKQGITPSVDVTVATTARVKAEGSYIEAKYMHTKARLSLQLAMGVLGPQPGENTIPGDVPTPPARFDEFMTQTPVTTMNSTQNALDALVRQEAGTIVPSDASVALGAPLPLQAAPVMIETTPVTHTPATPVHPVPSSPIPVAPAMTKVTLASTTMDDDDLIVAVPMHEVQARGVQPQDQVAAWTTDSSTPLPPPAVIDQAPPPSMPVRLLGESVASDAATAEAEVPDPEAMVVFLPMTY